MNAEAGQRWVPRIAAKAQWPILLVGFIFATAFGLAGANF